MTGQNSKQNNVQEESPRWNLDPRSVVNLSGDYIPLPAIETDIMQFTFTPKTVITPIGVLTTFPNVRAHPSTVTQQSELPIVRNPINPNILFGSSNSAHGNFINSAAYVSTDGGLTWRGSDTINAPNLNDQRGDPGPTIDKDGRIILTHLTSISNFGGVTGMGANYSTDNGLTWSATVQVANDGSADKNLAGTDDSPTSPFYGNSYFAWTSFGTSPANGRVSRTTNGGVSWSAPLIINATPSGHNAQGHDVAVGPNGEVFVCWSAGVSAAPFTEDFIGVAKSTDGGVSFTSTENAFDDNGSRSTSFNGWGIRTNGFPRIAIDKTNGARRGWIYIVVSQLNLAPAGSDADVVLHRSSDNGATWSPGIRVNQDALSNGKVQWFPAICVDDAGGVNVVYYDNRNFPSSGDSCAVFISRSIDGGSTFTDVEVSDHHFKPKPSSGFGGGYMGDYIGITSSVGKVVAIWMDDKANVSGFFNAWIGALQTETFPLNAFNLNTPSPGTRIQTLPNNTTNYTFTWDTAASTASYKWIFGSPTASSRQITLPTTGNSLTVTGGQLDNLLAGLGLAQGDSLVGQWDVWAFRNNATNDSMSATNGPRAITLKRAKPLLTAFNLISPPTNTTIFTLVSNTTPVNINWTKSGEAVKYKWLFARPDFSTTANVKLSVQSNNSGYDSVLTLRNSRLDSLVAGIGVGVGDSAIGQWRVYGYSANDSLSSVQTYNLTIRRGIPPTVTTSVDSISVNLPVGNNTTTRNFIIGNTGQFDLIWNISESSSSLDNLNATNDLTQTKIAEIVNLPKGAPDKYHGPEVTDGMGGPDAGGYRWIDSDEPGGPAFNWVDISTVGTPITTWTGTIDDGYTVVPLPFTFTYYENPFTQLKVCTNGWVGFATASSSTSYTNVAIPVATEPNNSLYAFWDDIDIGDGGNIYHYNDAANNRFIVEYKDVPHYSSGELYTFEVMIYGDGRIYYQYLNMASTLVNSCTIGNENSSGTIGLQVVYNSAYLHNNLAIKIEKGLGWLDESPTSGTIVPSGNQNVTVTFNSTGLAIGSYTGVMKVNSNDPLRPTKDVRVRLNVGTVGVQNSLSGIPLEFELKQNYPNPFNPTTKISFGIPKASFVSLKIYDVLGREVTRLINENKQPGYYDVEFNASSFSSGIYFYKIEAGGFEVTKRMLLVK